MKASNTSQRAPCEVFLSKKGTLVVLTSSKG